jgi:hypothetical protein
LISTNENYRLAIVGHHDADHVDPSLGSPAACSP